MYLTPSTKTATSRDQSVFGDGISIEDTMGVIVRYKNNAILTYSLKPTCPGKATAIAFNGTKGRLEMTIVEQSYVNSGGDRSLEGAVKDKRIILFPMCGAAVRDRTGGSGKADTAAATRCC